METINIKDEIIKYGDGSMSAAARKLRVNPSYLSRVGNCIQPPSVRILNALGLTSRIVYERSSIIDDAFHCAVCGAAIHSPDSQCPTQQRIQPPDALLVPDGGE